MKISFLVRWLPPKIDGVGDYTWNLACALRDYDIDARVFTSEEQQGSKDLPPHQCIGGGGLLKNEWIFPVIKQWEAQAIVKVLKSVTGQAPDWLCFQFVPQLYGRWCIAWQVPDILAALKKEFRCNIAVAFHEFISNWGIGPKDVFLASATRLQTKRMLSETDLAITTCVRYKDTLQHLSSHPLSVVTIPVGSNIEPVFIAPEELVMLRRQIFPDGARVFGLFSRLCPARNFSFAVKALQRARQQGLDAWLYLIGRVESSNPKLFKELMQLADKLKVKSRIVASGELSSKDMSIHLRLVDVFIFPQVDGISTRNTALMAAMAHGLPVVSFKPQNGNFDNFYIPCGILVDRGDEEGFIQAAVECLKNSDNLLKAAFVNSDYYYKNFSWPIIAKEYIKALKA